jgi:hypothetical protein
MYNDAILEMRSESFRYELKEQYPGLFPFKAHGRNKRNSEGDMIYRLFHSENERLLVRVLRYEADRMRSIPKLRTTDGDLGFMAHQGHIPEQTFAEQEIERCDEKAGQVEPEHPQHCRSWRVRQISHHGIVQPERCRRARLEWKQR